MSEELRTSRESTESFPANILPIAYHSGIFDSCYQRPCQLSIDNCSDLSSSTSSDASRHLGVENGSIDSTSINKPGRRRKLRILLCVLVVCLLIAGAAFAAYFLSVRFVENVHSFKGSIRVNDTFESSMSDTSSAAFQSFGERFCSNIVLPVTPNVSEARCKINNLSPGSVVVNFTLEVLTSLPLNTAQNLLTDLFKVSQVGVMTIYPEENVLYPGDISTSTDFSLDSSSSSSCSEDNLPIMPLRYTYPNYCGDYQVCVDGKPRLERCAEGYEFAFLHHNDTTVCGKPPNPTYCETQRAKQAVKNTSSTTEHHLSATPLSQAPVETTSAHATSEKDISSTTRESTSSAALTPMLSKQPETSRSIQSTSGENIPTSTLSSPMSTQQKTSPDTKTVPATSDKHLLTSDGDTTLMTLMSLMSTQQETSSGTTAVHVTPKKDPLTSPTPPTVMSTQAIPSSDTTTAHATSEDYLLTTAAATPSSTTLSTTSIRQATTLSPTLSIFSTLEKYVSSLSFSSSPSSASLSTTATIKPDWPAPFTCPTLGDLYIPANDTWPTDCAKFQRCYNGVSYLFHCAYGTHFVYSSSVQYSCNYPNDPLTFCNRMKASLNVAASSTTAATMGG